MKKSTNEQRIKASMALALPLLFSSLYAHAFTTSFCLSPSSPRTFYVPKEQHKTTTARTHTKSNTAQLSPTALNIWWYGGSDLENSDPNADECELVAVQIERTSANSRRIMGDIIVPTALDDVWAILTDYDNLSTHVPNLVESRRVDANRNNLSVGQQGDGSYTCRLYQKGAQKIVGFEFGASVTMDMCEAMVVAGNGSREPSADAIFQEERRIGFKCVESPFFSEFDGEWVAKRTPEVAPDGTITEATTLSYVVDVRPRGPVPVAALEWRIREDVPTNLRAVKKASLEVGFEGVMASRGFVTQGVEAANNFAREGTNRARSVVQNVREGMQTAADLATVAASRSSQRKLAPVHVKWDEDETMAAYLNN
uniref:Coenzyme Q-binding protein COQ10 START domain-containing protein n=1 Tax=Helicotheca tamesis TaxID=374047 RepID=A0A7S2HEK2_9STRA|mmetsp:Transcript_17371/g.23948  ORF Transcript_17371/g.23948 Transcript_17371/m.23948 type:complete len:369 (+) Transcript_17371:146-1252(+)|eukprot:CAMPEP_0185727104 /NCGR_PEP_ID=MMETSP1171-20130828/2889_1 /TAXON_ID=374046 /ORGANISM="Helicotheca tamensis, Strain CCMP826" /LENGTH=368 /DNA_ID=CAMNT_0028395605 /DNA_START=108 /DNA_END=1214 /DNA_ORIENTATION=+